MKSVAVICREDNDILKITTNIKTGIESAFEWLTKQGGKYKFIYWNCLNDLPIRLCSRDKWLCDEDLNEFSSGWFYRTDGGTNLIHSAQEDLNRGKTCKIDSALLLFNEELNLWEAHYFNVIIRHLYED